MNAKPIWEPSRERVSASNMASFAKLAAAREGMAFDSYQALHAWSTDEPAAFWSLVWDYCNVLGEKGSHQVSDLDRMPGACWFAEARLNFAQNLLRNRDQTEALVFWGEDRVKNRMTRAELYRAVAHLAAALRDAGVVAGDRIAAYMPNLPETLIAMLAAASIGAVFSSASPDFGVEGVVDRFGQISPKILVACDGYYYNGKTIDCMDKVVAVVGRLPSVERTIVVRYVHDEHDLSAIPNALLYSDFVAPFRWNDEIRFELLPFDHPLYILYSSGTTGVPKCIVHGAGGTLLQHLKEHQLHGDIRQGDRFFYFTTCGWMMWNWLVSGLASGATLLLYDGNPFVGGRNILFDYAEAERISHFGTSAKFIDGIAKAGMAPCETHDLSALRVIFSTGSPLVAEGFDYVYGKVKQDVLLASISGGTDIISCFVGGSPMLPVWRGEIQCAGLGMAVQVIDEHGLAVVGQKGELVCMRPFPSMPLGFWGDSDGARYRAAYFSRYENMWCHGDFAEQTERGGFVIYGRSDATLNPGGVRIGTAEIYRQVERLPQVLESLVIGQEWEGDIRVVLFVRLRESAQLDDALRDLIRKVIRDNASPRHVPARIVQVRDIPRTRSNKIVELAVRNVVHGLPVRNLEALDNPEALGEFKNRTELAS